MKYVLIFIIIIGLNSRAIGQNTLILKSGETMKGKIERFSNDTLTFNFKGNRMKLKSSEILAVYFIEKDITNEKSTTSATLSAPKLEGKISGVITYFFNDNIGDKPDVGSEILIINSAKVPNFNFSTVDSFRYAKTYKTLYFSYAKRGKVPDDIREKVQKYGVETEEGFDALDNRARDELVKIRFENITYCTKVVVDGNGTFSANLESGKYYVYITSNNRKGKNMTEVMGKVYCQEVVVRSGETTNVNTKFDLY
ncbi:MAG: hypothetical protein ABIP68_04795 [Ferruginibacter sp.]